MPWGLPGGRGKGVRGGEDGTVTERAEELGGEGGTGLQATGEWGEGLSQLSQGPLGRPHAREEEIPGDP